MSNNPLLGFIDMITDEIPVIGTLKRNVDKIKIVTDVLGITEQEAADLAATNPEAFIAQLQENRKKFEAEVKDRQGARELAMSLGLTPMHYFTGIAPIFIMLAGVLLIKFHTDNIEENAGYMVLTFGISQYEKVMSFFWGSSLGSKVKTMMGK